ELSDRLRRMFAARDDHVLFFDASDDAEYGFTVQVMDQARAGGAVTIAALTTPLQAPPLAPPPPLPQGEAPPPPPGAARPGPPGRAPSRWLRRAPRLRL